MPPLLMKAVVSITVVLVFYTIGVWSEHRAKWLKPVHLAFFWLIPFVIGMVMVMI